jgi:hypothetical protein
MSAVTDSLQLRGYDTVMTQGFILLNTSSGPQIIRDAALEPHTMTDVWFSTPESPLPAKAKSVSVHGTALAIMQWEGDVLKLWAFQNGALKTEYDSSPSFATCTITPPVSSGTELLGELFGKPENAVGITKLLARKKGLGFISETQRLEALLRLLGVDERRAREPQHEVSPAA